MRLTSTTRCSDEDAEAMVDQQGDLEGSGSNGLRLNMSMVGDEWIGSSRSNGLQIVGVKQTKVM